MTPSDTIPQHPVIVTRRAVEERQISRARRFEPVALPGDTRKLTLRRVWRAVWPSLIGAGAFLYLALLTIAWNAGYAG